MKANKANIVTALELFHDFVEFIEDECSELERNIVLTIVQKGLEECRSEEGDCN